MRFSSFPSKQTHRPALNVEIEINYASYVLTCKESGFGVQGSETTIAFFPLKQTIDSASQNLTKSLKLTKF